MVADLFLIVIVYLSRIPSASRFPVRDLTDAFKNLMENNIVFALGSDSMYFLVEVTVTGLDVN